MSETNNQTKTEEKDYSYFDKESQDWVYEFSDRITQEDWDALILKENRVAEFILLLTENIGFKKLSEVINHLIDCLDFEDNSVYAVAAKELVKVLLSYADD